MTQLSPIYGTVNWQYSWIWYAHRRVQICELGVILYVEIWMVVGSIPYVLNASWSYQSTSPSPTDRVGSDLGVLWEVAYHEVLVFLWSCIVWRTGCILLLLRAGLLIEGGLSIDVFSSWKLYQLPPFTFEIALFKAGIFLHHEIVIFQSNANILSLGIICTEL